MNSFKKGNIQEYSYKKEIEFLQKEKYLVRYSTVYSNKKLVLKKEILGTFQSSRFSQKRKYLGIQYIPEKEGNSKCVRFCWAGGKISPLIPPPTPHLTFVIEKRESSLLPYPLYISFSHSLYINISFSHSLYINISFSLPISISLFLSLYMHISLSHPIYVYHFPSISQYISINPYVSLFSLCISLSSYNSLSLSHSLYINISLSHPTVYMYWYIIFSLHTYISINPLYI